MTTTNESRKGSKTMTEERFRQTGFYEKISYSTFKKCDCTECAREDCIHREAYRRLPLEVGGLSLCPNLKGKNKLNSKENKRNYKFFREDKEMKDEATLKFIADVLDTYLSLVDETDRDVYFNSDTITPIMQILKAYSEDNNKNRGCACEEACDTKERANKEAKGCNTGSSTC